MLDLGRDIGDDFCKLRLAVRAVAVGEHPHRHFILADTIDAAGEMILGAERGLHKTVDDLAVGKALLLGALALGNGGKFGRSGRGCNDVERQCRQNGREQIRRSATGVHLDDAAGIGAWAQGRSGHGSYGCAPGFQR